MRIPAAAFGLILACLACAASAQTYSPAAKRVIAQARAASGGSAWGAFRGLRETGRQGDMAYQRWVDPVRYGARVETREPAGLRVHAFNGVADWQMLPGGRIVGADDRASLAQARTAAFLAAWGFYYPSRFAADARHLGTRRAGGRAFEVVAIRPSGGEPRELWFDRASGLLARVVDRTGGRPVTEELSDYRRVGGLLLPFRVASDRGGRSQARLAERIELVTPDRNLFSWAPPETAAAGAP